MLFLDRGHARAQGVHRPRARRDRRAAAGVGRTAPPWAWTRSTAARPRTPGACCLRRRARRAAGGGAVVPRAADSASTVPGTAAEPASAAPGRRRRGLRRRQPGAPRERRPPRAWALPALVLGGDRRGAVLHPGLARAHGAVPVPDRRRRTGCVPVPPALPSAPLPVPGATEMDLARARVLLAAGHARDALRLLERIGPDDPLRAEADAAARRRPARAARRVRRRAGAAPRRPGRRRPGAAEPMKCPKCNYIGFEPADRCRNCGYDFSLADRGGPSPTCRCAARSRWARWPTSTWATPGLAADGRHRAGRSRRKHDPSLDPGLPPRPAGDLPLFGERCRPRICPSCRPRRRRRRWPSAARRRRVEPRPRPTPRAAEPQPEFSFGAAG